LQVKLQLCDWIERTEPSCWADQPTQWQ